MRRSKGCKPCGCCGRNRWFNVARRGRVLWRATAGGRVDSPPTLYKGLAIFGSAAAVSRGRKARTVKNTPATLVIITVCQAS